MERSPALFICKARFALSILYDNTLSENKLRAVFVGVVLSTGLYTEGMNEN